MGLGLTFLLASLLLGLGQPQGGWWAHWQGLSNKKLSDALVSAREPSKKTDAVAIPIAKQASTPTGQSVQDMLAKMNLPAGNPERRLIEIYAQVEAGEFISALKQAQSLVKDHPNFQLAHLIHGDLLRLRYQPFAATDALNVNPTATGQMAALRSESRMRLDALRNRPPNGSVPRQVLAVSSQSTHVIAIDASRGRLYWFENQPVAGSRESTNLKLTSDFFISVGKSGIRKLQEGDGRTPLGIYYITSTRDRKGLPEFYGAGALPISYPNAIDVYKGRTGSGIWLHGTPPNQFVRAPLASDGCVVLANPDMQRLLDQVSPGTTPVVIAEQLDWTSPGELANHGKPLHALLINWQSDRSKLSSNDLAAKYAARPSGMQKVRDAQPDWTVQETAQLGISNLTLLETRDPEPALVATFEETVSGKPSGVTRRQHWLRQDEQWKLVQDSVIRGTPAESLRRATAKAVMAQTPTSPPTTSKGTIDSKVSAGSSGLRPTTRPEASVQKAVQSWATAWSHKNMPLYFKSYDSTFSPPGGVNRKAWEQDRSDRILGKNTISLNISNLKIQVDGEKAIATFVQRYKADKLDVSARKTLRLIKRGDEWRITQENVG